MTRETIIINNTGESFEAQVIDCGLTAHRDSDGTYAGQHAKKYARDDEGNYYHFGKRGRWAAAYKHTLSGAIRAFVSARLAELTTNDFDVVHCSGGDSRLPKHLRGETPDVTRMPTVAEVLAQLDAGDETIDAAIESAAYNLLDTDSPTYTDDLSVKIL